MEHRDPERDEDEPTRAERRPEKKEKERPKPRPRWSRDAEVRRWVNAAVQDAEFDR